MSKTVYTMGTWLVKQGSEQEVVDRWTELARWSKAAFEGALPVQLLRDEAKSARFISVGPWRSLEDVQTWRSSEGFQQRIAALKPLLEHFEPGLLRCVFLASPAARVQIRYEQSTRVDGRCARVGACRV